MVPIAYNIRNLKVRRATTLATAFGVGLVVFVFAAMLMLSRGIESTLARAGEADVAIVLRRGADAELSSQFEATAVPLVLSAPGISRDASSGSVLGVGELNTVIILPKLGTSGFSNVQIRGLPSNGMAFRPNVKVIAGHAPRPGTDEAMVGRGLRGRFEGTDIGQTLDLSSNRPVRVVGVFTDDGSALESEIWADLDVARSAFGREGLVSSIRVRLSSAEDFAAFKQAVEQNPELQVSAVRASQYYERQSRGTAEFIRKIGAVVVAFFSLGAIMGAAITMYSSIASRQREIGTLRALGFSTPSIMFAFLFESVVLSLAGGIAGALAAAALGFVDLSMMNFATWSEVTFPLVLTPQILSASLALAVLMGLLGGFWPARRAASMDPVLVMRV
jgi:putative ABC transport system permease protein